MHCAAAPQVASSARMATTIHECGAAGEQVSSGRVAILSGLNFVDGLFLLWFALVGALITIFHARVAGAPTYLIFHLLGIWAIVLLACAASGSATLRFLHDWYPLGLFIVTFEETSRLSFLVVDGWRDSYILSFESWLFHVPPTVWLNQFASRGLTEVLEVGYFSYFLLLMIVGGALYRRAGKREFRQVMTASALAYFSCYVFFILFPTEGPAHTLANLHTVSLQGGPFHWAVLLIQHKAGVHGNAFPSSHVAAGVVALIFAWRYVPRLGAALTPLVFLLCMGAVYDRYHYASDVIAGAAVGMLVSALVLLPNRPCAPGGAAPCRKLAE